MKTVASALTWIGLGIRFIIGIIILAKGFTILEIISMQATTVSIPYPWWVWILFFLFLGIQVVIAYYRDIEAEKGDKIGCGICTLLFVSLLGGIFTLLIPLEEEVPNKVITRPSEVNKTYSKPVEVKPDTSKLSQEEALRQMSIHENIYKKGFISKEEYEKRIEDIKKRIK